MIGSGAVRLTDFLEDSGENGLAAPSDRLDRQCRCGDTDTEGIRDRSQLGVIVEASGALRPRSTLPPDEQGRCLVGVVFPRGTLFC